LSIQALVGGTLSVDATLTLFVVPGNIDLNDPAIYALIALSFQNALSSTLGLEPQDIIVRSIVDAPILRRQLQTAATQPIEVGLRTRCSL
jgi:hypothetical protein